MAIEPYKSQEYKHNKSLTDYGLRNPLEQIRGDENMKIRMEKRIEIEDGIHTGTIEDVQYREQPYKYTDVVILMDDMNLKVGYPTFLNQESKLFKMLEKFGASFEDGKDLSPEMYLTKGKKVSFMTIKEKTDKGTFARIIPESLKPL